MDTLAFSDATTLASRIKSKEISSSELLEHYIARMERYNGDINAIIVTQLDKARTRAKRADEALAKGEDWGPLHGVPMTVKESFDVTGLPTTWGDPVLRDNIATSAFPHDQNPHMSERRITVNNEPRPYFEQIFWAGLTGVSFLPSTIVPTSLDAQGLPVGVQIVGREMADLQTIEFARKVAAETGGFETPEAFKD